MKFKTCPDCGAHLDFGESCKCMIPRCPLYLDRTDAGYTHEIHCRRSDGAVTATMAYETSDAMLREYRKKCCDNPFNCQLRLASSSVPYAPGVVCNERTEAWA